MHLPILSLLFAGSLLAAPQDPPAVALEATADGYRVDGPAHEALFDTDGARLTIEDPTRPPVAQKPSLGLRLVDWGGRKVAADAEPVDRGDFVDYEHGDVVERYRVRSGGFEQQFVVAEKPQVAGDLVFGIAVTGNVTCDACDAAQQELRFVQPDGQAIRYGRAKALDADGDEVAVATRYDGAGRIELVVPAAFVSEARYPLVVDPVVGSVMTIDTVSVGQQAVAQDAVGGRYMVVYADYSGATAVVRGRIFDGGGTPLTIPFQVGQGEFPDVAYTEALGSPGFFVAYEKNNRIVGTVVNAATGGPLMSGLLEVSQPGPGQPGSSTAPAKDLRPTVSCSSSSVIVGWLRRPVSGSTDPKEAWVRLLLPSGAGLVRGHEQMIDSAGSGALSFLELPDYHVRESGLLGSSYVTRAVWMREFTFPSVDWQIRTCSFRMRGANVFSSPTFAYIEPSTYVPGGDDITSDALYPSIGAIADLGVNATEHEFLLTWVSEPDELRALRYDLSGPLGFYAPVQQGVVLCAVSSGSTEYTLLVTDNTSSVATTVFRVLADGTVAATGIPTNAMYSASGLPSATSRPLPNTANEPRGNTSLMAWTHLVANEWTVEAQFFEPVAPTSTLVFGGCPGPNGLFAANGTSGGDPIPGNQDFAVTLGNTPPGSLAALIVGNQNVSTPLPGAGICSLKVGLPFLTAFPIVTNAAGAGSVPIPMPCPIPHGTSLTMQWAIYAPGFNALDWYMSAGRRFDWSHN